MIIDGKAIAAQRAEVLRNKIQETKIKPKLAIVLIGEDPASKIYVGLKVKKAQELGIDIEVRQDLNTDADGIIVQMPGPKELVDQIPPEKDVDGLREGSPFLPATVRAVLVILEGEKRPIGSNKDAIAALQHDDIFVIVGQGKLVGKPLADYLGREGKSVIRCDINTKDLKAETLKGDVIVMATGQPYLLKADMVKKGATVIDCGSPKPEVDPGVYEVAGAYTPVPGGVGPLTVISLLENTYDAAYNRLNKHG